MEKLGRLRRLYFRDGLSLSQIARKTGFARNTVKTWLKAAEGVEPKYRRRTRQTKISPFTELLTKALETDARRPKRDRRSALKLHAELKAVGFPGDYSRVTEFVRRWRENSGEALVKAFVPLKFELGEAFQFDWSEEHLVIGGVWRKIMAAHLKLCASRAFVLQAYPTQSHEMLFDAHTRSFTALGGIPRRGIYDNMKTAVDKVKKGKARIVNTRFDFCNVASGWEKGVVEKNVQDSRRRIWQEAGKERFGSYAELNAWLLARCRALWRELRHAEYDDLSIAEMLEHEQPSLMPMVTPFDGYVETMGKVSSTCLVIEDRNRYSVPCELVGQMVSIRIYPERIDFAAHDAVVASHPRSFERNQTRYDWQHYIPLIQRKPGALRNGAPFADMPEPLQRLRGLLLKHEGGDRVMAKVLAAVPKYGLEAVLVAVELV
ncbi:MAG: IS21 family transposase, partial [Proteobacteria bacterium]|nr:IS21 family transposase [Pseudomonadota bacterium]